MVAVQVGFAGLNVVSKLAMDSGMSPYVLIAYRNLVATLFLAPLAFFLERATMNQILYFEGLKYSTPTIACALGNTLPAITFIMAVTGTVLCVGGSMLMTFYKGSLIKLWPSHIHWRYAENATAGGGGSGNMALGAVLVIASCFAWSIWFIIQTKMSKTFASPYTSTAIMSLMAGLQCSVIGVGVEWRLSAWALGWDIRLAAVLYIGIIGSGLAFALMSWCIQKRGPLYVSMFSPLLLVIVAILGWAILDEKLYVGSAVGSALIVGGLYMVLWGKGREMKKMMNLDDKIVEVVQQERGVVGSPTLPIYLNSSNQEDQCGQP
ncbi:WAT1-related protein [Ananas comosus]|uniref:WAT1-related protein n=1 Tax=Ananas comosus TaxID=4615 RepID=A0A199V1I3_ANACO|nr:WAT1-related protein [Ananas comosus]